jgi:hypothetical protein
MDELEGLLLLLGYARKGISFFHPLGRRVIFLGDLTDRGPRSVPVMEMVLEMTEEGRALYVPGNHCVKLARWMKGAGVKRGGGIQTTIDEIESLPPPRKKPSGGALYRHGGGIALPPGAGRGPAGGVPRGHHRRDDRP